MLIINYTLKIILKKMTTAISSINITSRYSKHYLKNLQYNLLLFNIKIKKDIYLR